jgi:chemotaxis protein methyltransferase CheR
MAQSYANLGLYDKAIDYCEQAIALDSLCTDIYYLLAHIAEEKNQIDQAKKYLKRIIYLDQGAIAAYLDLSALYQTEGDTPRAKKMFGIAIELLQALPLNNVIRHRKNIKVADLLQQISNQ